MKLTIRIALALILSTFLFPKPAFAQTPTPRTVTDNEVNAVAKQLYCPVCENIPLDVCPTKACADWREEIRLKLSEGWSEAQIKQYFVDRFGDRVLGTPPAHGINWLVYVIPPVLIMVGIFVLYSAFKTWKQTAQQQVPSPVAPGAGIGISSAEAPTGAPTDDYVARLENELRKADR